MTFDEAVLLHDKRQKEDKSHGYFVALNEDEAQCDCMEQAGTLSDYCAWVSEQIRKVRP